MLSDDEVERALGCAEDYLIDADPIPESVEEWSDCLMPVFEEAKDCTADVRADLQCSAQAEDAAEKCWDDVDAGIERCEVLAELNDYHDSYIELWVGGAFDECLPGW